MTSAFPDKEYSLISLDLSNEQMAIELAEQTGCAVTVHGADGSVIATIAAATKN